MLTLWIVLVAVAASPVRAPAEDQHRPEDHSAWCAANPNADPVRLAESCRSRSWCAVRGNDNRIMHQACAIPGGRVPIRPCRR